MPMDDLPPFVPGLELSERFFREAVQPLLEARFPGLAYSAGRLDRGSDVLGFDTAQSRDHHWGPKTTVFLREEDFQAHGAAILRAMGDELPFEVDGYPTHFDRPEVDGGVLRHREERPISHGVTVTTLARFTTEYLGVDATRPVPERAWLAMPSQLLRTVRAGRVFHDGLGALEPARERLRWYPRDVWLYRMAAQWRRVCQEEAYMARCGDAGDELGSRLVAARQITELMRLCFLMEREYAPYWKWLGTAFSHLACAPRLAPCFHEALSAPHWKAREAALEPAYVHVMEMHGALGVIGPVEARMSFFHGRPYRVPVSGRFVDALRGAIQSPEVRSWPAHTGAPDQLADSTDVLDRLPILQSIAAAVF